jgi:predicted PurR-regulated permease PerM
MSNHPPIIPNWVARQVVLATLFIVAVGLGFWLLFRYRMVVVILFIAVVLGTALHPMVDWFMQRGLSRGYGLGAVYILLLLGLAAILFIAVPVLANQTLELAVSLPRIYLDMRTGLIKSPSLIVRNISLNLPANLRLLMHPAPVDSRPLDAVTRVIGLSSTILSGILAGVAVFLLTSFWIMESERTIRGLLILMPLRLRQPARELINAIENRVGAYLRGQLILCSAIGLLALTAYLIIGLPNALALALIAAVFEAIPVLGPALGAVPALLIAFSLEPPLVIWVLLATTIIQGLENYLLVPRVMKASVGVNPIIALLAMATFASLLGPAGALLAIPFAAVFQLLLDRFVFSRAQNGSPAPAGRDLNSALRYEVQDLILDVRKQLRKKGARSNEATDQIEDAIESLAVELVLLIEQDNQEKIS